MGSLREEISRKNFDKDKFVRLTLESEAARDELVNLLLTDRAIMVYYNCYYVLSEASSLRPECFMSYWDDFAGLLQHENSYHRDIGVTLLANLVGEDKPHAFDAIFGDYLKIAHDEKYMTGACCIRNLGKIVRARKDKMDEVFGFLIEHADKSSYTRKQEELLKSEILSFVDQVYDELQGGNGKRADFFILDCRKSISPKTRSLGKAITERRKIKETRQ